MYERKLNMDEYELKDTGKSFVVLDDDTRLLMSPRNWQLQNKLIAKANSKEPGKVTWSSHRYYTTLESALKDIIHIKTSQEVFKTATELLEANQRVINKLKEAFLPTYTLTLK